MLDLHAGDRDRMHSFRKTGIAGCNPFFFRGYVFDTDEHRRGIEPKIRSDLGKHGIGCTEYHESGRVGFDQSSPHYGRPCIVDKDSLSDRFDLGRGFLGGGARYDPGAVYQKTVIYDVMDIIFARDPDGSGTLTGTRRSYESSNGDPGESIPGKLLVRQDPFDITVLS